MSDQLQMTNMLAGDNIDELLQQYTDSQWGYLPDNNQGSYSQYIQFNTETLKNMWNCWHDNMVMVPLTISSSAFTGPFGYTPFGAPVNVQLGSGTGPYGSPGMDIICFKSNATALFGRIQVNTNTQTNIIDDNQTNFINAVRPALEHTRDWLESESQELMYSLDNYPTTQFPFSFTVTAGGGTYPAGISAVAPLIFAPSGAGTTLTNLYVNQGFYQRFLYFSNQFTYTPNTAYNVTGTGGVYTGNVFLKLCDVHDFFRQMNFPIINNPWIVYFYLNFFNRGTGIPTFPAFNFFQVSGTNTIAQIPVVPTIQIGNGINSACQLYFKSVKFPPNIAEQIASKMASGYSKKINYISTEFFNPLNNQPLASQQGYTQLITSTAVRPLRVWMLPYQTGTLGTYTSLGPQVTNCVLKGVNLKINNENYFLQTLNLPQEFYNQVRECMVGYGVSDEIGSLMSYVNWNATTTYYVFNVSRIQDRLKSPNDSVSIQIQYTISSSPGNNANVDIYYLIEKLYSVRFDVSSADTRVIVGAA